MKPDTLEFSEPVNIWITGNRVRSLDYKDAGGDSSREVRFVIPSLCDAYATLGADSLGGQNNLPGVRRGLQSFVAHGFTHIQSVADGNWVSVVREEIRNGKIYGPDIQIAAKPLLAKSRETEKLNPGNYFISDVAADFEKEISRPAVQSGKVLHLFYRYNPDQRFNFDSKIVHRLNKISSDQNKILSVTAFADRVSILDSITSGVFAINHPIPLDLEPNLTSFHYNELVWSPFFNNYFFLSRQGSPQLKEEFDFISKRSRFFKTNFASSMESLLNFKNIPDGELEKAKAEYNSYITFFKKHKELARKMVLSGGSGALFSFPGISGIQELRIIRSIIGDGKDLLRIPTENTCSFLNVNNSGKIKIGNSANLLVLRSDPLKNIDILYEPESVIRDGSIVYPEPVKKHATKTVKKRKPK
ncbi:MAG: hypothetical protein K8R21_12960 [Leptospira sp.]|nr:hypothetical protein [Leptospira sp.]